MYWTMNTSAEPISLASWTLQLGHVPICQKFLRKDKQSVQHAMWRIAQCSFISQQINQFKNTEAKLNIIMEFKLRVDKKRNISKWELEMKNVELS